MCQGDFVNTRLENELKNLAGHFALSVAEVLNPAATFEVKIFEYNKGGTEPSDPQDPSMFTQCLEIPKLRETDIEHISTIQPEPQPR